LFICSLTRSDENIKSESENFKSSDDNVKILLFVSQTCPHCVTYMENEHEKVVEDSKKNNNEIRLHISGASKESNDAFDKYNVEYVPACILLKDNNLVRLKNGVNLENIKEEIKKMK
jgi:thiol-disulfide isomerase/thioredoxin